MTDQRTVVPRDRHGLLPRMHYDAMERPSPTTQADVISWCLAQREEEEVKAVIGAVTSTTLSALLKGRIATDRIERVAIDVMGAMNAAAGDLHHVIREFGYDPTDVGKFEKICTHVVVDRLKALTNDIAANADGATGASQALRRVIHVAAIGTTLADALSGAENPDRALGALTLAYEESDEPEIKDMVTRAIAQINDMLRR